MAESTVQGSGVLRSDGRPEPGATGNGARESPWQWLAWMPVAVFLLVMVLDRAVGWRGTYESPSLVLACNFVFSTLASIFIAYLAGRSFLVRGTPGVLLLGCGVVAWGAAGVVANLASRGDDNLDVTIHNCGVWVSALSHFMGAILLWRAARYNVRNPGPWLAAAYIGALGAVGLGAIWAVQGHSPRFFVPTQGGTAVRQAVLGSAIAMFVLAAVVIWISDREVKSAFRRWYIGALMAIAIGLLGILIQSTLGGPLAWAGRGAMWLGGVYMVLAGLTAARETRVWGIGLEEALWRSEERIASDLEAMTRLHELGTVFVSEQNLEAVLHQIVQTVITITAADFGAIHLLDQDGQALRLAAQRGFPPWWVDYWQKVRLGQVAFGTGQSPEKRVLVEDIEQSPMFRGTPALEVQLKAGVRACQSTPLASRRGQLLGMFSSYWRQPRQLEERELRLLDLLARQTADYFERRQAEGALRQSEANLTEQLRAMSRLQRLSAELVQQGELKPLLEAILAAAADLTGTDKGNIQLYDPSTRTLRILVHQGLSQRFVEHFAEDGWTAGCSQAAAKLERVLVEDVEKLKHLCGTVGFEIIVQEGIRSIQCTPLVSRDGRLLGMLNNHHRDPGQPTEQQLRYIDLLARQTADLLERDQVEAALRRERERLVLALRGSGMGAYELNLERDVLWWSPEVYSLFGVSTEAFTPTRDSFSSLVHPEDREDFWRRLKTALAEQQVFTHEFRIVQPQGEERWIANRAQTEYRDGRPVRHFGIALDITERKRAESQRAKAEQAVREVEARLRAVLQATGVGLWLNQMPLAKLAWDGRTRELFFVPPDVEPTIDLFWNRLHPDDREPTRLAVETALRDGTMYAIDHRAIEPGTGRVRWIHSEGHGIYDGAGKLVRFDGVNYDVTERKEFQKELERLVAERTVSLQELVGELEHFSYSITHDMRAPLRAMRAFSEMLKDAGEQRLGEEEKRLVARIITGAERMDALITDALNYSKTVRSELPVGPVDVERLLRGMLDTYPEFHAAKADIVIAGKLPLVLGNDAGLTQCFSNLIGNAVKFTPPGERAKVRIWSEAPARGEPDGWVRLWVEDHGIGISNEMLPRVFHMFARGSSPQAGTGIGLALARKVVERMGGRIGVESEPGGGSRFWVELKPPPLNHAEASGVTPVGAAVG